MLPLRGGLDFWEYVRGSTKSTLETDDIKIKPMLSYSAMLRFLGVCKRLNEVKQAKKQQAKRK